MIWIVFSRRRTQQALGRKQPVKKLASCVAKWSSQQTELSIQGQAVSKSSNDVLWVSGRNHDR